MELAAANASHLFWASGVLYVLNYCAFNIRIRIKVSLFFEIKCEIHFDVVESYDCVRGNSSVLNFE